MEIYHSTRKNARYEQIVLAELHSQYPNATFYDTSWHPSPNLLMTSVNIAQLLDRLNGCRGLPVSRIRKVEKILTNVSIPPDIRVATVPEAITFDFALIENGRPALLIEVQERQHRRLSVSRPRNIYNASGWPIPVPRFAQRLLRDVWRIQVARANSINYLLVWFDWLDSSPNPAISFSQLNGVVEYAKDGEFRISGIA